MILVDLQIEQHNSTYANRMIVPGINSIVIGPYIIDPAGTVTTIVDLLHVHIGGMALHLTDPTKVYMLGMDGPLWEVDLVSLEVRTPGAGNHEP
jgi:hypothetical protein